MPIRFETQGCRLNTYETEAMKTMTQAVGGENLVVLNTCAVTSEAVRKARQEVRRLRKAHPEAKLVVTGCAAQTDPALFSAMEEVDHVLGNHEKMQQQSWRQFAPDFIGESPRVQVDDIMSVTETAGHLIDGFGTRARAYVQVQNGCDHRCTFCIIPYGRGNSRSVPAGDVVTQIKHLVDAGYREVVLTGVDLTSWGADLPGQPRLGDLVMRILKLVPDLPRLRISSIDSIEADPALIEAMGVHERLMPHLHLSLQHGDDLILKRMKRRHLRDDAIAFCEKVRALRPDIVFGADIIAGFPTETEAMFANSLDLIRACRIELLHVFPYSPRPNTPAAKMPQVDGRTIKERAGRLRDLGKTQMSTLLKNQVGIQREILMESPVMGRTPQFTEVTLSEPQEVGHIIPVTLSGVHQSKLTASVFQKEHR